MSKDKWRFDPDEGTRDLPRPIRRLVQGAQSFKHLRLLAPSDRNIAYLGWAGKGNLGDEVILWLHQQELPQWNLVQLPAGKMFKIATRGRKPLVRALLAGGGTLIGNPGFSRRASNILQRYTDIPAFMVGIGVMDPSFTLADSNKIREDIDSWIRLFERFDHVTVRGPRSQEILAAHGFKAEEVGDPSLLLADSELSPPVREKILGLNIGISSRIWGDSPDQLLDDTQTYCKWLISQGWQVRLFPVWPNDIPYLQELGGRIGNPELVRTFSDIPRFLEDIRRCRVFVGMKLHSVALASAVYVPSLMLEYQPKCFDFQLSIGREKYNLRTDRLSIGELMGKTENLDGAYDNHRNELFAAIAPKKTRLEQEMERIRNRLHQGGLGEDGHTATNR